MRVAVPLCLLLGACAGDEPLPPPPPAAPVCTETVGEICTIAGSGLRGFNGHEGPALDMHLFLPTSASVYPNGDVLVVDFNNMTLKRLDDGILTTVVGSGLHAYAFDGIDALESGMENPVDAVVGPDGTIFIMELHGARVLAVDPDGWLTVVAGSPNNPGYEALDGDDGPAREAGMSQSVGLALGADGSLFIGDTNNHAVRQVDPDGIMHTLAGNGESGFVDGIEAETRLWSPQHLAAHNGFVYVADQYNHAVRRIEVATRETVTFAGTGVAGFSGDGGPAVDAQLSEVQGVAVAPDGTVFVADSGNHVIRRIDIDGTISTLAGTPGVSGYAGDFGPAEQAELSRPNHVVIAGDDLLVADTFNDVIRRIFGVL